MRRARSLCRNALRKTQTRERLRWRRELTAVRRIAEVWGIELYNEMRAEVGASDVMRTARRGGRDYGMVLIVWNGAWPR